MRRQNVKTQNCNKRKKRKNKRKTCPFDRETKGLTFRKERKPTETKARCDGERRTRLLTHETLVYTNSVKRTDRPYTPMQRFRYFFHEKNREYGDFQHLRRRVLTGKRAHRARSSRIKTRHSTRGIQPRLLFLEDRSLKICRQRSEISPQISLGNDTGRYVAQYITEKRKRAVC